MVVTDGQDKLQDGQPSVRRSAPIPAGASPAGPSADRPTAGRPKARDAARPRGTDESVAAVHSAAGRDLAADGGHPAGGHRGLPAAAGFGAAAGGLPDHPGADVLSRREPGGDGVVGHRAAGAPVRPGARPEADDLHQFLRQLAHHAAVRARPEHRRGRAGGAGGHQRRRHLPAARPAEPADLQQDQPGRRADPHAGADLGHAAAVARWRTGRHHAGAEDLAAAGRRTGDHQRRPEARRCASRPTPRRWPPTA